MFTFWGDPVGLQVNSDNFHWTRGAGALSSIHHPTLLAGKWSTVQIAHNNHSPSPAVSLRLFLGDLLSQSASLPLVLSRSWIHWLGLLALTITVGRLSALKSPLQCPWTWPGSLTATPLPQWCASFLHWTTFLVGLHPGPMPMAMPSHPRAVSEPGSPQQARVWPPPIGWSQPIPIPTGISDVLGCGAV